MTVRILILKLMLMSSIIFIFFLNRTFSLPISDEENEIDQNKTENFEKLEFEEWTEEDINGTRDDGFIELVESKEEEEERDEEEVECETPPDSFDPFRNGLADDSYSIWPDKKIPYVIGVGFNETAVDNIKEAVTSYNTIFANCISWVPKTNEAVFVEFENTGTCFSKIGRAYWPFPLSQTINIGKCSHLIGHIKHEMMHTLGFYHEHSRSDRDMFVEIRWSNIADGRSDQFQTYRWTTAYGEQYDYESIMHYSKTAFSKTGTELTIVPRNTDADAIGKKVNLSPTDIVKIKKLYKCPPYDQWESGCNKDEECGVNEYCTTLLSGVVGGQCRTQLSDGSLCVRSQECLHTCSGGVCSSCTEDSQCPQGQYCANKYLPLAQNICSSYCGELCLLSSQCGGSCTKCTWSFTCQAG